MSKKYNVFISHHGADDRHVQNLKRRLSEKGYYVRNSSIDSTRYQQNKPSDRVIARYLRRGISWAGTFICMVGKETYTRPWVNYEIKQAFLKGKEIIGIYAHGCSNSVVLPDGLMNYGGPVIGSNSLNKLGEILDGKPVLSEKPDGSEREPINPIVRINC